MLLNISSLGNIAELVKRVGLGGNLKIEVIPVFGQKTANIIFYYNGQMLFTAIAKKDFSGYEQDGNSKELIKLLTQILPLSEFMQQIIKVLGKTSKEFLQLLLEKISPEEIKEYLKSLKTDI